MSWGETLDQQRSALRWDIKRSLKNLCKKLADIGEECFVVTVNVSNGWVGHMGSVRGNEYINQKPFIAYDFLDYCRELDESGMVFDDDNDNAGANSGEESPADHKENSDHESTDTGEDDANSGSPRITVSQHRDSDSSTDSGEESPADHKENSDHESTDTGEDDANSGSPRITVSQHRDSDSSTEDPAVRPIEDADIVCHEKARKVRHLKLTTKKIIKNARHQNMLINTEVIVDKDPAVRPIEDAVVVRHEKVRKVRQLKMTTKKIIKNARQQIYQAYSKSMIIKTPAAADIKSCLMEGIGNSNTDRNMDITANTTTTLIENMDKIITPTHTSPVSKLTISSSVASDSLETSDSEKRVKVTTINLPSSDSTSDPPSVDPSSPSPGARVISMEEGGVIRLFCWTCDMSLPNRSSFIDHIKWRVHMFKCQAALQCFKCFAKFRTSTAMYTHMKACDLMSSVTRLMETECSTPPSGKVITETVIKPDGSEIALKVTREDGTERPPAFTWDED